MRRQPVGHVLCDCFIPISLSLRRAKSQMRAMGNETETDGLETAASRERPTLRRSNWYDLGRSNVNPDETERNAERRGTRERESLYAVRNPIRIPRHP